jgi:hypothetical protein
MTFEGCGSCGGRFAYDDKGEPLWCPTCARVQPKQHCSDCLELGYTGVYDLYYCYATNKVVVQWFGVSKTVEGFPARENTVLLNTRLVGKWDRENSARSAVQLAAVEALTRLCGRGRS